MHWFRQVSPLLIFALVSLLYCSQVCVVTGHVHAAASAPSPESDSADAAPCHSRSTAPQNTDDSCSDCGAHFFLASTSSPVGALTAAGAVFSTVGFFAHLTSAPGASSLAYHVELELRASPFPRYLSLAVLRL
jgi:hypothetical protein